MLVHKLRRRFQEEKGFTLIELLVVILIIGILAAIALPSFLGQRSKGQDASAKSDARNMVSQEESYYSTNEAYKTAASGTDLPNTGLDIGSGQGQVEATGTTDGYTITAHSKSGGNFVITKDGSTGVITRTCSAPGTGACPSDGKW